jgi:hypothetical protein
MAKTYIVRLEAAERARLKDFVRAGKRAAYKIRHANALLMADANGPGWSDTRIAEGLGISVGQIEYLRKRFVEQGLEACLDRKKQERPSVEPMFDGEKEAKLIALACGEPPKGRARWSLRLLADRAVELRIVETTSHETVRQTLKKMRSNRT